MSKDKQIEEMAKEMCGNGMTNGNCAIDDEPCHFECAYGCFAEKLYAKGYRKTEWISVEERLPKKDVRVLVYIKSDRGYTEIDTDRLDKFGFIRWGKDVTHWMPLPEAPRKEDEKNEKNGIFNKIFGRCN